MRRNRSGTQPAKPLVLAPGDPGYVEERAGDVLDITDVLGKRAVGHHGRITVREENAAGALEVMSRFALDPRWLMYLPPTMAPCGTSSLPNYLEHPAEAFASFVADGVTQVVCEEKHVGSRAVVLVCRDESVAQSRFGAEPGPSGAIYTRTERSLFKPELTEMLLDLVRAAVTTAGLWTDSKPDGCYSTAN